VNGFEAALVVVAVIVFVIVSQLKGMTLSVKRTVVLPMVLSGYGLVDLSGLPHVRPVDVACIGASAVLAAAVGAFQGAAMHLEERDGALWGRMPLRGLWLWGALVLSRALVTVLALSLGAKAASSVGSVILVLGVNRMAQAAVIAARAFAAGVPFSSGSNARTSRPRASGRQFPSPRAGYAPVAPTGQWGYGCSPAPAATPSAAVADGPALKGARWSDIARGLSERWATTASPTSPRGPHRPM
jgi:hypothetical protein